MLPTHSAGAGMGLCGWADGAKADRSAKTAALVGLWFHCVNIRTGWRIS